MIKLHSFFSITIIAFALLFPGCYENGDNSNNLQNLDQESEMEEIEIVAVRDGHVLRFLLKGGIIGVRIRTDRVSGEEFKGYGVEE